MYQVTKRMEVAGSHSLSLPYESKCSNTHGHNWIIEVTVSALELDATGMVIDFTHIKEVVNKLDHTDLNAILPGNPTAEKIAKWVADRIQERITHRTGHSPKVVKVSVQESEGNLACYIP